MTSTEDALGAASTRVQHPDDTARLQFTRITKTYPGVRAVDDVSLTVRAGEVHALVGENGAGKSTLMGIAAGSVVPDGGEVRIGGELLSPAVPRRAAELGLAIVYQHSSTISDLTVRENLVMGSPPGKPVPFLRSDDYVARVLSESGLTVHPDTRVSSLSTAERQLLEIGKALAFEAKVLVLDEPTESLTQDETEKLFERIGEAKRRGTAIVYISHRLADVRAISDRLTVLRDGRSQGTFDTAGLSELGIVELMIGRAFNHTFPDKPERIAGDPVLEIDHLSGDDFHDVSLAVAPGEIVGIAGVEGNGQRSFIRALAGVESGSGALRLSGRPVSARTVAKAQRAGIYYLPGDRHLEGLFLGMTVAENATLLSLPQLQAGGIIGSRRVRALASRLVSDFDVRTPSLSAEVGNLSGGNQQKVLLGRVVAPEPKVLIVEEPTRGVDVGARAEIYVKLRQLADSGVAVIVLSSDAVELAGLCDRVAVFSRGQVAAVLGSDELSERAITSTALTAATTKVAKDSAAVRGRSRLSRFLGGDYLPIAVVAVLFVAAAIATQSLNDRFLSPFNIFTMLVLTTVLVFASYGQTVVVLTGGIDLSIGPMIAVSVCTLSIFATAEAGAAGAVLGIAVAIGIAVVVGVVNAALTRNLGLPSVLSTLISGIVLQGVALLMRPRPGGTIGSPLADLRVLGAGPLPYVFLLAVVVGIGLELALRWSRAGLQLRASGADEAKARLLGAKVNRANYSAYILSAVLAALGGVVMAAIVGVGDSTVGLSYTLLTVTVVVLAGTSVFGGRGTIAGVIVAALLLQTLNSSMSFLQLGTAWQYWLPSILILVGAAAFSRIRRAQEVTS